MSGMEIERYFAMAERHIAETEALIVRQQRVVAWLLENGRDAARAQTFLALVVEGLKRSRSERAAIAMHSDHGSGRKAQRPAGFDDWNSTPAST